MGSQLEMENTMLQEFIDNKLEHTISPLSDLTPEQKQQWKGLYVALHPATFRFLWGPRESAAEIIDRPDDYSGPYQGPVLPRKI